MQTIQQPLISVIVPVFNLEDYVAETIESILAQENYSNFELLIVDDNSTDATFSIITNYAHKDERIKIFTNKRKKGAAGARNTGLDNAKGEWITFLDGDDLWEKTILFDQMAVLNDYPDVQIIISDLYRFDENNMRKLQTEVAPLWKKYFYNANQTGKLFRLDNPVACFLMDEVFVRTGTIIIKHDLIEKVGFFDEKIKVGEDNLLWIKLARCVEYLIYIPKPLMTYRPREGSLTNSGLPLHTLYGVILLKELLYSNDFSDYKKYIRKHIAGSLLNNSYYYRKTGRKIKAIETAIEAIWFDFKKFQYWKNLLAALLLLG
jgi:glycosyltransferase involved in cell wall biosynthesis